MAFPSIKTAAAAAAAEQSGGSDDRLKRFLLVLRRALYMVIRCIEEEYQIKEKP